MNTMENNNVITTEEVCKILGRTRQQIYIYVKQGKLKAYQYIKPYGNYRFKREEVERFLNGK